ncbi:NAD(P) transhydrogenase [Brachionus plicatilis]|uniref:NAD(P) transhydrogenase n=1 Tax=Brachionus plicatilis TaxID=10195 RepID=A0A3M7SDF8_BRAPC|nr:NAD(P) transhydrogenase [Brachionus plicatilis]
MPLLLGFCNKFLFLTVIFYLVCLAFMFSSMENSTSYKALLLAANNYARFLTGQITKAEKVLSCKVMVKDGGFDCLSFIELLKT